MYRRAPRLFFATEIIRKAHLHPASMPVFSSRMFFSSSKLQFCYEHERDPIVPKRDAGTPSLKLPDPLAHHLKLLQESSAASLEAIHRHLDWEWDKILQQIKLLEEDRTLFEEEKAQWKAHEQILRQRMASPADVLTLNVGGEVITTLRSTLLKHPGTTLYAMFNGCHQVPEDPQGRVFIDRDIKYFKIILDWLRSGVRPYLATQELKKAIGVELDYFGLSKAFLGGDLNKAYDLTVSIPSPGVQAENNAEYLRVIDFYTGACAVAPPQLSGDPNPAAVEVNFPVAIYISGVVLAPYFGSAFWDSTNGAAGVVEFFDEGQWKCIATIPNEFGKQQEYCRLRWNPKLASKWRIAHPKAVGLSYLLFKTE